MKSNHLLCNILVFFQIISYTERQDLISLEKNPKKINLFSNAKLIKPNTYKRKIGILSNPISAKQQSYFQQKNKGRYSQQKLKEVIDSASQAEGNYFEFIKNNNMEPVLIEFHQDINKILHAMNYLDGILLPGGETLFKMDSFEHKEKTFYRINKDVEQKYLQRVHQIVKKAKEINEEGREFVVYAICLGFQAILITESDYNIRIGNVGRTNMNDIVYFSKENNLIKKLPKKFIKLMRKKPLIFFNHNLGFTVSDFNKFEDLRYEYNITMTYKDQKFGKCVAAFEHKHYPIYGLQFHPEKFLYDTTGLYDLNPDKKARAIAKEFEKIILQAFQIPLRSQKSIPHFKQNFYDVTLTMETINGNRNVTVISKNQEIKLLEKLLQLIFQQITYKSYIFDFVLN